MKTEHMWSWESLEEDGLARKAGLARQGTALDNQDSETIGGLLGLDQH